MPGDESRGNVCVAIRARPALAREIQADGSFHGCLAMCGPSHDGTKRVFITTSDRPILIDESKSADTSHVDPSLRSFVFDHTFDQSTDTEQVCVVTRESVLVVVAH